MSLRNLHAEEQWKSRRGDGIEVTSKYPEKYGQADNNEIWILDVKTNGPIWKTGCQF